MKGQHADVVHGPNADPHGDGSTGQPKEADPAAGGGYPASHVKRHQSCQDRDTDRECDEPIVVRTHQSLIGHNVNLHRCGWGSFPRHCENSYGMLLLSGSRYPAKRGSKAWITIASMRRLAVFALVLGGALLL